MAAFRQRLTEWRNRKRAELSHDDNLSRRPDLAWAARSFVCCLVMPCGGQFYSPEKRSDPCLAR